MKVLYSQLKKYLPDLKAKPEELGEIYTLIGYMQDGPVEEVEYNGKKDYFIDLEVRQNRADCFGVIGLARELSAYYNIPLKLEEYNVNSNSDYDLPIEINATDAVKRVMAVKIDSVKVEAESPAWLKDYLNLYDINSINLLVDLTNYVMLETAHASHAFDVDLVGSDKLIWELNNGKYRDITTLAGERVELKDETLLISEGVNPLSLSIIGGKAVGINQNTNSVIVEMAVYDGGLVRRNSRSLKIITEASSRLEKFLDPESIPYAFSMLISLIIEHCGGEITSKVFDSYIQKEEKELIKVDLDKVQQIAGIEITYEESLDYLTRLGFEIVTKDLPILEVKKPVDRLDIEQTEDVFEEIIRLKGFQNIPKDNLTTQIVNDVTPNHLNIIDQVKSLLTNNGFDEVRSWVLVDKEKNENSNFSQEEAVEVQNSINAEVPILRQTINVNLLDQFEVMLKNAVNPVQIFEIGKVFHKNSDKNYTEHYALALLQNNRDVDDLKTIVEKILRNYGIKNIDYKKAEIIPKVAHPETTWDIIIDDKKIGIIFLSNDVITNTASVAEINISMLSEINKEQEDIDSSVELNNKLVSLDTNIETSTSEELREVVENKLKNIQDNIWSWEVIDQYESEENIKYTIRITYLNLSDPEAKELHEKTF